MYSFSRRKFQSLFICDSLYLTLIAIHKHIYPRINRDRASLVYLRI